MLGTEIVKKTATEILDSRSKPTILCKTELANGAFGKASVPCGASRGKNEAKEKRDEEERYSGLGVKNVCRMIETELFDFVKGAYAANQKMLEGL